jgi:hypothetical protein
MITPPYCHPKRFKNEIEKAIKELLAMGHIRPSNSPFSSSVVLVLKKDCTMRMCIDYRALNEKTIKNSYHIPHIDEFMETQSLYTKESKCGFGMTKLLYLGHIINAQEVQVH